MKEQIKDELRNVLETSVNSPRKSPRPSGRNQGMEKWASMKEISKDQIYSRVKRSNSMINLGRNEPRKYSVDNTNCEGTQSVKCSVNNTNCEELNL